MVELVVEFVDAFVNCILFFPLQLLQFVVDFVTFLGEVVVLEHLNISLMINCIYYNIQMIEGWQVKQACAQKLQDLQEHYFIQKLNTPFKHKNSLLPLYTFVYEMCTTKPSYDTKMLELYKAALKAHIVRYMNELNEGVKAGTLIQAYNRVWESYEAYALLLAKRVFAYLDRYFLLGQTSLMETAFQVYRETFFNKGSIGPFFDAYVHLINEPRHLNIISHQEALKFSKSVAVVALNFQFFPVIHEIYLREAAKHYDKVFEENKDKQPMVYINIVNNLTFFEKQLQKKSICLDLSQVKHLKQSQISLFKSSCADPQKMLFQLFEERLVKNYTDILLRHPYGLSFLLKNEQINNLKTVYLVYAQYEGFEKIRAAFYNFLVTEGDVRLRKYSEAESAHEFIGAFYQFYSQYSKVVTEGFFKNEELLVSLNNGIERLAAKFDNMTEMLFKYARAVLDKGNFSAEREKILTIFEKLSYKDEFLNYYCQSLEKIIINGKLIYMIEKQFINSMNEICGSEATSHLDKKLQDFIESMPEELMIPTHMEKGFDVKVVSLQLWENKFKDQMTLNLTLINPIKQIWEKFQLIYGQHFSKRKLTLLPFENKLTLSLMIDKVQKLRLKCNLVQACILLFCSTFKEGVYEENIILELTLQKTFLHNFLEQIPQLLVEEKPGFYRFNWDYQSTENLIDLDSKALEEKTVTNKIYQDREILIQAAIIKAVKRAKQLSFQELVEEVSKKIKLFRPHPSSIKVNCEKLIKKDMVCEEEGLIKYKQ